MTDGADEGVDGDAATLNKKVQCLESALWRRMRERQHEANKAVEHADDVRASSRVLNK